MILKRFVVGDIARVREMFCEAFELECYFQNRFMMRHLLDHYLCGYLMEAEYAMTAWGGDGVEGFVLGCSRKRRGGRIYGFLERYHRMFLPFFRNSRAYIRNRRLIAEADEALRRDAPHPESELILFVVKKELRGQGVGRKMLTAFKDWLVETGVTSMQLFTDDYCDVDYYRRRGYVQLGMRRIEFAPGIESMFYLFSIDVDKI